MSTTSPNQHGAISAGLSVLVAADPKEKITAVQSMQKAWKTTRLIGPAQTLPNSPARPEKPVLVTPNEVPRRRFGSLEGRAALLHAVAHIEFNAINLATDMMVRFCHDERLTDEVRPEFVSDWINVAVDEARHFDMVSKRLGELGFAYGDFPAHNGLWEAAISTSNSLPARLAVAPMILEARGLDVTPAMIKKFKSNNDLISADILTTIYKEEIGHVAKGVKWFQFVSESLNQNPNSFFKDLARKHFKGKLKPPFNQEARLLAGFPTNYYEGLS